MKHLSTLFLALILVQITAFQAVADPLAPAKKLAMEGKYAEAVVAFEKVRKESPQSITPLDGDQFGAVYAMAKNSAGHLNHCLWLFKQFPLSDEQLPETAERTAKAYVVCNLATNKKLLRKSEEYTRYAVSKGKGGFLPWFHIAHGMSHYRLGNYDKAGQQFRMAVENPNPNIKSLALAYQSMTIYQRGYKDKAKGLLKQAQGSFEQMPKPGTEAYAHQWSDVITVRLALDEAKALMAK